MRNLIAILMLVTCSSEPAIACQGPFSTPYDIHLSHESQVYLGKVVSIEEAVANAGTPYEIKVTKTKLKVIRAWQSSPPAEASVANVHSNLVSDRKHCVRVIYPNVGEEWLVVAKRYGDSLHQDGVMGFKLDDEQYKREIIRVIDKLRPTGGRHDSDNARPLIRGIPYEKIKPTDLAAVYRDAYVEAGFKFKGRTNLGKDGSFRLAFELKVPGFKRKGAGTIVFIVHRAQDGTCAPCKVHRETMGIPWKFDKDHDAEKEWKAQQVVFAADARANARIKEKLGISLLDQPPALSPSY